MDFPASLPPRLKRALPPGVSLFPRPRDRRWILSSAPDWRQKTLPAEVVTCEEAVAWVRRHLAETGQDPGVEMVRRKAHGLTVDECAVRWIPLLTSDERCAPATLKGHVGYLSNWIRPRFGTTPIAALEVPVLRAWLRELHAGKAVHAPGVGDKIGPRSILHVHSTFASFVDAALAEGWLHAPTSDPWLRGAMNVLRHPAVRAELHQPEDADPIALPIETVQQLLDAVVVPLERRARYALGFCEGMRDGEIAGVKIDRIVRGSIPPVIKIEQAVALVGAKGPKGFAKPKAPKTRSSKRTLPLHLCPGGAIDEWLADGWAELVGRDPKPEDYLFPRPDGGPSRPRSAELLREDLRAAGLPDTVDGKPVEMKSTRSSFLTWLSELGVSDAIRKRLAGHRASDVTERHYTHREIDQLAEAIGRIPLRWRTGAAGAARGSTVEAPVEASTVNPESPTISAPPRRLERPTNGLGKRRRAGTTVDNEAQIPLIWPPQSLPDSGHASTIPGSGHASTAPTVEPEAPASPPESLTETPPTLTETRGPGLARAAPRPAPGEKKRGAG